MPRFKMPKKSTLVDMTAMTDMVFLILNFFIMSTSAKPDEPVAIVTPSSINTQLLPDADVILVSIDKTGRVFFSMDGQPKRRKMIEDLNQQFKLGLDEKEMNMFMLGASVGVDMKHLKEYLGLSSANRKKYNKETGIPADTINNELAVWIEYAQAAQGSNIKALKYCIKADNATPYPMVKQVMETFKKKGVQHLNLVTNLEEAPEGTAAAMAKNDR
ncbi:biopolymer transporter ExbD [Chitinophaga oryziterrae]|uniref:Biopolymer transporter ExbD n=1 Tax=Chitinophaga oryziterrae TaxID=1031224 RepID=A0A6N8J3T8_9BACT|nr:biopolymer transporter ExbD [Chitinophaga oryziterrae]MVT39830.1 biopolymer transporter ExbD [Chitinophaga oryziterrae]